MQTVEPSYIFSDQQWQQPQISAQMGELGYNPCEEMTYHHMQDYAHCVQLVNPTVLTENSNAGGIGIQIENLPHHSSYGQTYTHQYDHQNYYTDSSECQSLPPISNNSITLTITEQPFNRIRFRYQSERGSHGGMIGESTTGAKKTFPKVKLENYDRSQKVFIRASLWTNTEPEKEHVHKLQGKSCSESGDCVLQLGDDGTCGFQGIGISFTAKKDVKNILKNRIKEQKRVGDGQELTELAEIENKFFEHELNAIKILFQAFYDASNTPIASVFSKPVLNQKSSESGELKILRLSRCSGHCRGEQEVFLLCDKINKKEIKVRFFERDETGNRVWEQCASFAESDVHHQVAIVFKTPPYRYSDIRKPVDVHLELFRPKDNETSEPKSFTYKPPKHDYIQPGGKRRYIDSSGFGDYGNDPNYPSNFGSQGGGGGNVDQNTMQNFYTNSSSPSYNNSVHQSDPEPSISGSSSLNVWGDPNINPTSILNESLVPRLFDDRIDVDGGNKGSKLEECFEKISLQESPSNVVGEVFKVSSLHSKNIVGKEKDVTGTVLLEKVCKALRDFARTGDQRTFLWPMRHLLGKPDSNGDNVLHIALTHQPMNDNHFGQLLKMMNSCVIGDDLPVNQTNNNYQTPLHLATLADKPDLVQLLLMYKADPKLQDFRGNTSLHLAVLTQSTRSLTAILNKQSYLGNQNVLEDFINVKNYDGFSAIHLATMSDSRSSVIQLCDVGADVNVKSGTSGKTPLHLAVEQSNSQMIKCLLQQATVDVDVLDFAGNTPLHLACSLTSPEIVYQLMEAEANPWIENFIQQDESTGDKIKGITAYDIARRNPENFKNGICGILCGDVPDEVRRKITERISQEESARNHDSFNAKSNKKPSSNFDKVKEDEEKDCLSPIDSGFESGSLSKHIISDRIIEKLCQLLDPPSLEWKKLAQYVFDPEQINDLEKLDNHPTRTIIKIIGEQEGNSVDRGKLFEILRIVELNSALEEVEPL